MLPNSFWRAAMVSLALAAPAAAQDGLRWEDNLQSARQLAAQSKRLVLVHFTAPWCEPCQRLEQNVFSQPGFGRELVGSFVAVKINVDHDPVTARQYGVQTVPADAVIRPSGELVELVSSPRTGPEFTSTMNRIAAAGLGPAQGQSRDGAAAMTAQSYAPPGSAGPQPSPPSNPASPFIPASAPAAGPAAPTRQGTQSIVGPDERYADYYNRRRAEAAARTAAPYLEQQSPAMDDRYGPTAGAGAPPSYSGRPGYPGQHDALQSRTAPGAPPPQPAVHPDYYAVQQPSAPPPQAAPPQSAPPPGSAQEWCGVAAATRDYYENAQRGVEPDKRGPAAPPGPTDRHSTQHPAAPPRDVPKLPPGCAPLGLDGYCPVTLWEKPQVWTMGDTRFGAQHKGRTYLFASAEQQRKFLTDPDRYAPVLSGNDPVMALDHGQTVAGSRSYGGFYGQRVYLFSSESSYQQFSQNPNRYAAEVYQAELSSSKR